jgi:hypothetical protein
VIQYVLDPDLEVVTVDWVLMDWMLLGGLLQADAAVNGVIP